MKKKQSQRRLGRKIYLLKVLYLESETIQRTAERSGVCVSLSTEVHADADGLTTDETARRQTQTLLAVVVTGVLLTEEV